MLKERVLSAIVLIALVLCALFLFSPFYFALSLGLVATLGVWEWTQFARFKQPLARLFITAFLGAFIFLWLFTESNYLDAGRVFESYLPFILLNSVVWWGIALLLVITYPNSARYWGKNKPIHLLFAFATLIPFIAAVLRLRLEHYMQDPHHGLFLLLYVFVLVWAADSGAYFAGRAFGKHKLAPKVSPGKTWEGVFGGLITAAILACAFIYFSGETLLGNRAITGFITLSVATVAISILGDLTESMFKRESGIKDSSQLIPGHGGVLDRIDSLTAAVPFFTYFYFFVL
ncbi:phosphatidate cytidylyltransferase [Rodentibacter pneumotropicus]|uniref:phosphatidate cytidylyltransferase n=1 Tax=Rodentibacter pneumotropicus TaxID=758 RepID=UPI00036F7B8C|nr:phosphatidate cytidylyltransferase [Rodentibacter pneumotropicus]NBH76318.1 phosphatidate cytidylyltransferase [Rodentibacter pneumotropicus]OOF64844.1 phosphatidate cytidylyltransferase [Rodentibacter pneumotropicus]THA03623.1 phosphatidate cytidylyltransferase [Rodentibacter pneumotropicus]THA07619.1 phosphatidate cytidylyltransferase [Rodentibacter pneumotropicus]THA10861.1 phosphatidate cytidylyltransferase [Rodentibacter pneumotropicus]